jgi:hypothetical protein
VYQHQAWSGGALVFQRLCEEPMTHGRSSSVRGNSSCFELRQIANALLRTHFYNHSILRDYKDLSYWFEDTNSKGGDQRQSEPVVGWGKEETGEKERAAVLFVMFVGCLRTRWALRAMLRHFPLSVYFFQ